MDAPRALRVILIAGAALFVVLAVPRGAAAAPQTDSCTACHGNLPDRLGRPVAGMRDDAHAKRGLSCAACHGGNARRFGMDAHDRAAGFLGAPSPRQVPEFCARCHSRPDVMRRFNPKLPTDQLARFRTSIHGQKLAAGDTNVATCISCHGVHPVRAVARTRLSGPARPPACGRSCRRGGGG